MIDGRVYAHMKEVRQIAIRERTAINLKLQVLTHNTITSEPRPFPPPWFAEKGADSKFADQYLYWRGVEALGSVGR
jgi:hypothetical protein